MSKYSHVSLWNSICSVLIGSVLFIHFSKKLTVMLHNLFYNFSRLPMVWDFIIPIAIIFIFCAILMWEGEYGHAARKRFKVVFKRGNPDPDLKV
jgi:cytochrome c oxidase subunit IV